MWKREHLFDVIQKYVVAKERSREIDILFNEMVQEEKNCFSERCKRKKLGPFVGDGQQ